MMFLERSAGAQFEGSVGIAVVPYLAGLNSKEKTRFGRIVQCLEAQVNNHDSVKLKVTLHLANRGGLCLGKVNERDGCDWTKKTSQVITWRLP